MADKEIFYQIEGSKGTKSVNIDVDKEIDEIKREILKKLELPDEAKIFVEDEDKVLSDSELQYELKSEKNKKLHISQKDQVNVVVSFNGKIVERTFSPSITIHNLLNWVTKERELEISEINAPDFLLQIKGSTEQPTRTTHLGALVPNDKNQISFDLVTPPRVNGY